MSKKPLSEQVLVVTGASSGLGRALARLAGESGAKVVVTARNEKALDNCVAEIERAGGQALAVPGDVADRSVVERGVEAAAERFGRIDTYVAMRSSPSTPRPSGSRRTSCGACGT
jgi:NADP-dependent 3-hydroxy acid dehydrogenase YdfG